MDNNLFKQDSTVNQQETERKLFANKGANIALGIAAVIIIALIIFALV